MIIKRKYYSDNNSKEELQLDKLNRLDRFSVKLNKVSSQNGRDYTRSQFSPEALNKVSKTPVGILAVNAAAHGVFDNSGSSSKDIAKKAVIGGGIGLASGLALDKSIREISKRSKKIQNHRQNQIDLVDVSEGKMTQDEFLKRKQDRKNNK